METVTIYRLRHTDMEVGPWHAMEVMKDNETMHNIRVMLDDYMDDTGKAMSHRPIWADCQFPLAWNTTHVCGTESIETLRSWFYGDHKVANALFDAGFTVYRYTVPVENTIPSMSGLQICFKPDDAIEAEDLTFMALVP